MLLDRYLRTRLKPRGFSPSSTAAGLSLATLALQFCRFQAMLSSAE